MPEPETAGVTVVDGAASATAEKLLLLGLRATVDHGQVCLPLYQVLRGRTLLDLGSMCSCVRPHFVGGNSTTRLRSDHYLNQAFSEAANHSQEGRSSLWGLFLD